MRYECRQLARQHGAAFLQLYIKCPLEACLARNAARSADETVPDGVITKMAAGFEEPVGDKHAWEVNSLTVDSSTASFGCDDWR